MDEGRPDLLDRGLDDALGDDLVGAAADRLAPQGPRMDGGPLALFLAVEGELHGVRIGEPRHLAPLARLADGRGELEDDVVPLLLDGSFVDGIAPVAVDVEDRFADGVPAQDRLHLEFIRASYAGRAMPRMAVPPKAHSYRFSTRNWGLSLTQVAADQLRQLGHGRVGLGIGRPTWGRRLFRGGLKVRLRGHRTTAAMSGRIGGTFLAMGRRPDRTLFGQSLRTWA